MTRITDDTGARWVAIPPRKRRSSPRALKFADVKVHDQIMMKPKSNWHVKIASYFIVTDIWFDPVAGQNDPVAGTMIAYRRLDSDGEPKHRKSSTTIRGLASQQFDYADMDYIAMCRTRKAEAANGSVIGIGQGAVIRRRPKLPGSTF